ncbi:hypothetical protein BCR44DRAFT_36741, partial [Catenaria anguillulae PL171]
MKLSHSNRIDRIRNHMPSNFSPPPSTTSTRAPPPLTNELLELTLCMSLHSPQRAKLKAGPMITTRLNVLSRTIVPSVTKVAVHFLPFIPLEEVAQLADLVVIEAMGQLALSRRGYRPLTYSSTSPNFLTVAAQLGHLAVFEWWYANKSKLNLFVDTLDVLLQASQMGHVNVLEWWYASGLSLEMREPHKVWSRASEAGHVDVLQFWLERGLDPPTDCGAMDSASRCGHVHVLQWWKESGMPLEYSHKALLGAVRNRHDDVLEWWSGSGLRLLAQEVFLTAAAIENLDFEVLHWLEQSQLLQVTSQLLATVFSTGDKECIEFYMSRVRLAPKYLEPVSKLFVDLSAKGRPDMLQLAVDYGFVLPTIRGDLSHCLEVAARIGSVETLEWWLSLGATRIAPNKSDFLPVVQSASACGHVQVLDWLVRNRYFPNDQPIAPRITHIAAKAGHLNVLRWFASNAHANLDAAAFLAAVEHGHVAIVEWWLSDSRLPVPPISDQHAGRTIMPVAAKRGSLDCIKPWYAKSASHMRLRSFSPSTVLEVLLAACEGKQLRFIKWWVCINAVFDPDWIAQVADKASAVGSVEILDWLLDTNLFDKSVIYHGPARALSWGHSHVLEWWERAAAEHQLQIRFVTADSAAPLFIPLIRSTVLRSCAWLLRQGTHIEAPFPKQLVKVGNPALIGHLLSASIFQPPTFSVFDEASKHGQVCMLEGWKQLCDRNMVMLGPTDDPQSFSKEALQQATLGGFVQVLDWWKHTSNLPLKLPYRSLAHMRTSLPSWLDKRVSDWWSTSGLLQETDPASDEDVESDGEEDEEDVMEVELADPVDVTRRSPMSPTVTVI